MDLLSDFPVSVTGAGDGSADVIVTDPGEEEAPAHDIIVLDEDDTLNNRQNNYTINTNNRNTVSGNNNSSVRYGGTDMHTVSHIGHVTADEDDDLMDMDDDGSAYVNDPNLMDEDDEAMQFETVANKMFQSETEVVPLPIVDQKPLDIRSNSNVIIDLNNSHSINPGECSLQICYSTDICFQIYINDD